MALPLSFQGAKAPRDILPSDFPRSPKSGRIAAHVAQAVLGCIALALAVDQVVNTTAQTVVTATPFLYKKVLPLEKRLSNISRGVALVGMIAVSVFVAIGAIKYCRGEKTLPRWHSRAETPGRPLRGTIVLTAIKVAGAVLGFLGFSYVIARFVYDPVGEKVQSFFGLSGEEDKTLLGTRACIAMIWLASAAYAAVKGVFQLLANNQPPRIS